MIEFRHFWGHDHYDIVFNQNQLFSELTLRNMRLHCNSSPSSIRSGSGGLQHLCGWYCNKILKHNLLDNDFQYCTKRHLALVTLKMIWLLYPPLIFYVFFVTDRCLVCVRLSVLSSLPYSARQNVLLYPCTKWINLRILYGFSWCWNKFCFVAVLWTISVPVQPVISLA